MEDDKKTEDLKYVVNGKPMTEAELNDLKNKPSVRLVEETPTSFRILNRMNG